MTTEIPRHETCVRTSLMNVYRNTTDYLNPEEPKLTHNRWWLKGTSGTLQLVDRNKSACNIHSTCSSCVVRQELDMLVVVVYALFEASPSQLCFTLLITVHHTFKRHRDHEILTKKKRNILPFGLKITKRN